MVDSCCGTDTEFSNMLPTMAYSLLKLASASASTAADLPPESVASPEPEAAPEAAPWRQQTGKLHHTVGRVAGILCQRSSTRC